MTLASKTGCKSKRAVRCAERHSSHSKKKWNQILLSIIMSCLIKIFFKKIWIFSIDNFDDAKLHFPRASSNKQKLCACDETLQNQTTSAQQVGVQMTNAVHVLLDLSSDAEDANETARWKKLSWWETSEKCKFSFWFEIQFKLISLTKKRFWLNKAKSTEWTSFKVKLKATRFSS